jgi:hypothetical protein
MSRDNAVAIATSYWLADRGDGVRVPEESKVLHFVHAGSTVHPTSHPMGTGAVSPAVKWSGREVDQSPPASAEVKKTWVYISTPL